MSLAVGFTKSSQGSEPAPISQVGGKGHSLIRMYREGLAIPPGCVLSVAFFEPWFEQLRETQAWAAFVEAKTDDPTHLQAICDALKAEVESLPFDDAQRDAITEALSDFAEDALFAVRSSSPEEDLAGSSFAGGYETVLGVRRDALEGAVRRAFASCLDARIVVYKLQHGFDPQQPTIAVVIQQQIASEIAGVGFSINPLTNDFDEAIFSSNWGLGETVVAGLASPDFYVVDKRTDDVLTRQIGAKETSIWLLPDGGTEERPDPRHDVSTLSDTQLAALTQELRKIDAIYDAPMDIEWAFADSRLYLLQARPITTYVPLHPDMITEPDARRRLYFDITISIQGVLEPLSVMTTSVFRQAFASITDEFFGSDITASMETTIPIIRHGRFFANLSNLLAMTSLERIAGFFEFFDPLASAAILEADPERYKADHFSKKDKALGIIRHSPSIAMNVVRGRLRPENARDRIERRIVTWKREINAIAHREEATLSELADALFRSVGNLILEELMPLLLIAKRSHRKVVDHFHAEHADDLPKLKAHLERIDQSLPGNVTVEMGLMLDQLAEELGDWPREGEASGERLEAALLSADASELPEAFFDTWQTFLERYGHRAQTEIEVSQPRYRDSPGFLLQQVLGLRDMEPEHRPRATHARCSHARHAAFDALSEELRADGWLTGKRFRSFFECIEHLGGLRESHKYCMIYALDRLRTHLLGAAYTLVAQGQLDRLEEVWDLTLDELDTALSSKSPDIDLRELARANRAPHERLEMIHELPRVIDSRGRIYRPPAPPARDGELVGQAISAGVVQGRVKALRTPDEKPLRAGEILVTRATDPGWTPLFVPAAAVVLEVGGILQHGALVAREYGKPCVAGITNVFDQLRDGMLVEVDGSAGIIRILEDGEEAHADEVDA